ncbi:RNA polymerase I-specific transcription initiation factor Rrn7 [Roseovarius nanhaiticus]|uniref:RNA polymerase I-specific transcription initiation factor Rrn7 n=1 Tax=Roseovarius nanhaiticus TaxID=573024 RepID=A0A1N7G5C0_9RHOB|nr:TFIIB-type zinc finger domain-containing protein [Roseovarius nanhaiticus]SEK36894.1 RNA polymerase I-specific transcription initiation factor Rrn7 [Roseovarius nanhaiticus]SIS07704.1 RNA polymerase I-specific transcription initiation factor Rrn7 [Roseovarius nanhaiticus]
MYTPAPDAPTPAAPQHRFPCDACGADLRFAPDGGALICDHCGNRQEIAGPGPWDTALREQDLAAALRSLGGTDDADTETEERQLLSCPNCGAEVELAGAAHAGECPFCATPMVTCTGSQRRIKPRGVLPFAIDEETARGAMAEWLGQLWFAPNGLKEYARKGRRLNGIYVPYWTFDAATRSAYSGERGTVYYETRTVMRDGKRQTIRVPKVRWRSVSGRVARAFDDVLVLASHALPKRYTDALPPWDLGALEPYNPEYLAGFAAEGYTVALDTGYGEAREAMDAIIARDVKFDIGGDRQRIHRIETEVSDASFKHILLPVWMAAYKYRGQSYRFVVNGRTGRVQGERPWSAWKIAFAVLIGLLVAAAIGYVAATQ